MVLHVDEEVLGFDVAMDDAAFVQVLQSPCGLAHHRRDNTRLQAMWVCLDDIQQRLSEELEDQMQGPFSSEGLLHLDDVLMLQCLEDLHLAQHDLPVSLLQFLFFLFEALDRNDLLGLLVLAFQHYAIGPLPKGVDLLVPVHLPDSIRARAACAR
eukprot:CAMPEP_0115594558 /NCGR_PEP_ID=MMETSP0272-20121206/11870_1 /TAXON_ID=71861 /ORGANISM="Scrippsiella trochoidea, Strain CCMP3099" /LENGTH=154 /DNA_ID=CAMNT_0003029845 /DNA_START=1325 /DNA_END=1786 /DNA_ORIENTATION=+